MYRNIYGALMGSQGPYLWGPMGSQGPGTHGPVRVPGLRDPGPGVPGLRNPGPRVPGLRDPGPGGPRKPRGGPIFDVPDFSVKKIRKNPENRFCGLPGPKQTFEF